ncbi:MAG: NADH-quinone oxidoreductase subunit NuoF [Bacillota bacterium]
MAQAAQAPTQARVIVGMGTCGIAAGATDVYQALAELLGNGKARATLAKVGCIGMCEQEVLVDVALPGERRVSYGDVTPEKAARIVEQHVREHKVVEEWVAGYIEDPLRPYQDLGFYKKQHRRVLVNCGLIDPEEIIDYIAHGGYQGLVRALSSMTQDEVIDQVKRSGLRGRGGAGFPSGLKWEFTRQAPGPRKYVVCNGDEGDPGAFMDRSILEGDPHAVIEGMILAAYAIGAQEGYLYVRAEYPLAIKRLKMALRQAEEERLLGDDILGTSFSFHLKIKEGAGAFVCGEETALLASIEGERGMPRARPPFPAQKGLWGCPTNINNVETYANVPAIVTSGGDWYAQIGTERSKGTKVFALAGKIANTGLAEVPMGITLREIIYDIGGGVFGNRQFKAVQIGGPSGGCLPDALLDTPVDYDSLTASGAIMGSGGLVVLDDRSCMVDIAKFFLKFTQSESCGKCTPCREGTLRMLELLERISEGKGEEADIDRLESLAKSVKDASLCGLGQTAPNPVLTTLRYFRDEYGEHIVNKRCPAGACIALVDFYIEPDLCKKCGLCAKACPTQAITGSKNTPYVIDKDKCIKCGSCEEVCATSAVLRGKEAAS